MTRKEILQAFDDINFVYNDCTKYDTLKRMLEELTERKRGEWRYGENDIGLDGYWCTVCGEFVLWDYKETIDFIHRYNYCPNCGADMRKILPKP